MTKTPPRETPHYDSMPSPNRFTISRFSLAGVTGSLILGLTLRATQFKQTHSFANLGAFQMLSGIPNTVTVPLHSKGTVMGIGFPKSDGDQLLVLESICADYSNSASDAQGIKLSTNWAVVCSCLISVQLRYI
jgi:hypothetical protein